MFQFPMCVTTALIAAVVLLATTATSAAAQEAAADAPFRQSQADAWWTGPMLANSAATLPKGHVLVEPYIYSVVTRSRFDVDGARRTAAPSNSLGSLTYILYGLTDRIAIGLIPTGAINAINNDVTDLRVGLGDTGILAQFRLTSVRSQSSRPTISVAIQETVPTGKHDRLGNASSDGFGSGAYTTTLSLFSQTYFWLPNGRILRMRANMSQSISSRVKVEALSVYGTAADFRGHAIPGASFLADTALEYSLSRRWVIATDVTYGRSRNTRVTGYNLANATEALRDVRLESGASTAFGVAPAIEFSWKPTIGVLIGMRVIAAGRNTAASVTPAIAINIVH